ncbi:MAG: nucleotidyltransferase family protein [Hydrogenophaga sp.]|nr:nucleotidyltransferase family protein [Hydrogenophaga sp.]
MSLPPLDLLVNGLQRPASLAHLSLTEWDLLVRQGRQADLLARLGAGAMAAGSWDAIPPAPRLHLASAMQLAGRQHLELRHEVRAIERALRPTGLPVVLLKGAAYAQAGLRAAQGRMVSDVDILVPRERLADVESALMMAGWVSTNRDAYDQRYYRTWMHELPPLRHVKRGSVLDVHHAILPLTARYKPDTQLLLRATVDAGGDERVRTLAPADRVLHSAAHLFHEGELDLGLRGLVDLDALLLEAAQTPGFWLELVHRARQLDLERPLFHALRYTRLILNTPYPDATVHALATSRRVRMSRLQQRALDALYLRALRPDHASTSDAWTPLARFLLYLRGHWLRMPPGLLAGHLARKLRNVFRRDRVSHASTA